MLKKFVTVAATVLFSLSLSTAAYAHCGKCAGDKKDPCVEKCKDSKDKDCLSKCQADHKKDHKKDEKK